jgi:hypothetical protein
MARDHFQEDFNKQPNKTHYTVVNENVHGTKSLLIHFKYIKFNLTMSYVQAIGLQRMKRRIILGNVVLHLSSPLVDRDNRSRNGCFRDESY